VTTRKLVILFGAGATRGVLKERIPPPPLDQDFFDIASQLSGGGTRRLAARVTKDVFDLYSHVSGVGLEQYFREIEARAEIGQFAKSKNKPKDWARRQSDLEELIRRVLIQTTGELGEKERTMHRSILKRILPGDTIITFNYDTIIEESFAADGIHWDPSDGYGFKASGTTLDWARRWRSQHPRVGPRNSEFHLLKLHGSINWTLYKTNKVRLKPRPYVVRARNGAPVFDKCSVLPPGWHKRIDINPYRQLWRKARLELEKCSSLAIIGYSLPETDLIAHALLAEVCRLRSARKHYLKHLHICDPNDQLKDRFSALFAPALGPKGHVYRYKDIEELSRMWETRQP
jgi:SIR2-like protein